MKRLKVYDLTLSVFFIILFFPSMYCAVRILPLRKESSPQELLLIEGRKLASIANTGNGMEIAVMEDRPKESSKGFGKVVQKYTRQLFDRSFQQNIEQTVSDRFPVRLGAIQLSKAIDRVMIYLAYGILRDPVIPADMDSYSFVALEKSIIISGPEKFDDTTRRIIDDRIKNYAQVIEEYPEIHIYLYCLERLEDSPYHPLNKYYRSADRGQSVAYFEQHKPAGLTFGKLALSSYADHAKYYFGTDHHWNITGALQAYDSIYGMLARNNPAMSPALKHDEIITFPDIEFYGSLARSTLYPIQPDRFAVAKLALPSYQIIVNGQESAYNQSTQYLEGEYVTVPYVNHYGEYYGEQRALIEYVFENQSNRSLLIISDSYSRPMQPMLASHYKHTYVVDFRRYPDFSLAAFLAQYPVDDILVLGSKTTVIISPDWMIQISE